ncbi:MAG: lytic transglycosylase domain-containing protein [Bacteroidales bacterium]|nr:lytic transglycosylase domain-containing protein [Candidatus Latescibacterota bacterium]
MRPLGKKAQRWLLGITASLVIVVNTVIVFSRNEPNEQPTVEMIADTMVVESHVPTTLETYLTNRLDSIRGPRFSELILRHSAEQGLPPELVAGIMLHESGGQEEVVGQPFTLIRSFGESLYNKRAQGLMQIVWELWEGIYPECGTDILTAPTNICYGTRIYRLYVDREEGDYLSALRAYSGNSTGYIPRVLEHAAKIYLADFTW